MVAAPAESLPSGKSASAEGGLKQVQSMLWEEMRQIDEPRAQTTMKAWIEFLKESAGREHTYYTQGLPSVPDLGRWRDVSTK